MTITKDYEINWSQAGVVYNNLNISYNVYINNASADMSYVTRSDVLTLAKGIGNTNLTKADTLVLAKAVGTTSITKATLLVLSKISQPIYLTKTAILVLAGPSDCLTHFCQCWKITRRDGISFAYTTFNEKIDFMGTTFKPCNGVTASAAESGIVGDNDIGDVELTGICATGEITSTDILNGLYDNAVIDGYLVGWSPEDRGSSKRIVKGIIGKATIDNNKYTFEILTLGAKLKQTGITRTYSPACRFTLGIPPCPTNLVSYLVAGGVTNITEANSFNRTRQRQFYCSTLTQGAGHFDNGTITWVTGQNSGIQSEVKSYDNVSKLITLWNTSPYEIQIGDTFILSPGCNKSKEDHLIKFGLNLSSFGGFPNIPGSDAIRKTPNAR